jgi:hypothetical protein
MPLNEEAGPEALWQVMLRGATDLGTRRTRSAGHRVEKPGCAGYCVAVRVRVGTIRYAQYTEFPFRRGRSSRHSHWSDVLATHSEYRASPRMRGLVQTLRRTV